VSKSLLIKYCLGGLHSNERTGRKYSIGRDLMVLIGVIIESIIKNRLLVVRLWLTTNGTVSNWLLVGESKQ